MRDKQVVNFVAGIAERDNYKDVVVATCRRFPHYSSDYLIEIIRAVYHFNGWLQTKNYSRPARLLAQNKINKYQQLMDELYAQAAKDECENTTASTRNRTDFHQPQRRDSRRHSRP